MVIAQSAMLWNAVAPPVAQIPAEASASASILRNICAAANPGSASTSLAIRFLVWRTAPALLQSNDPAVQPAIPDDAADPPLRPSSATGKRSRLAETSTRGDAKRLRTHHGGVVDEGPASQPEQVTATVLAGAAKTIAQVSSLVNELHGHSRSESSQEGERSSGVPPSALHALLTATLSGSAAQPDTPQPSRHNDPASHGGHRALALCAAAVLSHGTTPQPSRPTSAASSGQAQKNIGAHREGRRRRRQFSYTDAPPEVAGEGAGLDGLLVSGLESGYASAVSDGSGTTRPPWPQSAMGPDGSLESSGCVRAAFLNHLDPRR